VAKDNTVSFDRAVFQIPKRSPYCSYAGKRVDAHILLDGSVVFFYQEEKIANFDSKKGRTQLAYIERTASEVSTYGPKTTSPKILHELSP